MTLHVKTSAILLTILSVAMVVGCASNPMSGTWNGVVKIAAGQTKKGAGKFSGETKTSTTSTLNLNGDATYTAKFQEVNSTGTWKLAGSTLTLCPETYMGMSKANFPSADAAAKIFGAYDLTVSADGKTLSHADEHGTVTFTKGG